MVQMPSPADLVGGLLNHRRGFDSFRGRNGLVRLLVDSFLDLRGVRDDKKF